VVEQSEIEKEYEYTIEFDDGTEFVHLYFADVIDIDKGSFVRFDPLYELGNEVERTVSGETIFIPYSRVIRIIKRKPPD
jgi:hypothetical protein